MATEDQTLGGEHTGQYSMMRYRSAHLKVIQSYPPMSPQTQTIGLSECGPLSPTPLVLKSGRGQLSRRTVQQGKYDFTLYLSNIHLVLVKCIVNRERDKPIT